MHQDKVQVQHPTNQLLREEQERNTKELKVGLQELATRSSYSTSFSEGYTEKYDDGLIRMRAYTDAVVHEGKRMGNVAPLSLPHMFTRDTALRGYSIPKVAKNYFVSSPLYWLIRINFLEADGILCMRRLSFPLLHYITGAELCDIQNLYTRRCQRKALQMVSLFSLLVHGKWYQCTKSGTNRTMNSFYPQAIRLLSS
ncbi:cytochrome P450 2B10-like [Oncorhynchus masou masou]|uniref:cytochrome P450 2B10-like n=1 Tax=Oncorhynchus masou masou TaxID=90313 RepID=UPI003184522D